MKTMKSIYAQFNTIVMQITAIEEAIEILYDLSTQACSCIIMLDAKNTLPEEEKRDKTAVYLEEQDNGAMIFHWWAGEWIPHHSIDKPKAAPLKACSKETDIIKQENE